MLKGNMSKLLKQAQDMQKKLEEAQSQLGDIVVAAEAGGGMVSVKNKWQPRNIGTYY